MSPAHASRAAHRQDDCRSLIERAKALLPPGDATGRYLLDMALAHVAAVSPTPPNGSVASPDQPVGGGSTAIA